MSILNTTIPGAPKFSSFRRGPTRIGFTSSFPDEIRSNVKLRNFCIIEGEHYCVPQLCGAPEVGSIVATGKTAKEAIDKVKAVAEQVKGYEMEVPVESMDEALEDLKAILGEREARIERAARRRRRHARRQDFRQSSLTKLQQREGWA